MATTHGFPSSDPERWHDDPPPHGVGQKKPRHRYSLDDDRCVCGGEVVWFEADDYGPEGEGCEVEGMAWGTQEDARRPHRDNCDCDPCLEAVIQRLKERSVDRSPSDW